MFRNRLVKKDFIKLIQGNVPLYKTRGTLKPYLRFADETTFRFNMSADCKNIYTEYDGFKYKYALCANGDLTLDDSEFKISESTVMAFELSHFALLCMFKLTHRNRNSNRQTFIKTIQQYLIVYTYVACFGERVYNNNDLVGAFNDFNKECNTWMRIDYKLWDRELKYVGAFIRNIHTAYLNSI